MTYNECRNGVVTLLAALSVPDRVTSEIVGHSNIATTMNIYARVASEIMKEATEKLGKEPWQTVGLAILPAIAMLEELGKAYQGPF
ncbi:hypothetical protein FIM08_00255 [SAR202 cluster bacterium AC-647-N09_OGT_505m]|nr:hypothetical protein [SAR202 cluster bacterium AC-647-N09_OGT_505m]